MATKLDMSKAYDRVEWNYLRVILLKLGFNIRWVALLMKCVTTVTYSTLVMVNHLDTYNPNGDLANEIFCPLIYS